MKPVKIVSTQNPNILQIRWAVSNFCNYSCEYCWPGSHEGTHSAPKDLDLVVKNFNYLIDTYKQQLGKTKIHLMLSGGEPTVWKDLALFIQAIKADNDVYVTLLTNGSRTLRWWQDYGHLIDNAHISYHIAQANADHVISVADTLFEYNKKVTVKVMMDRKNWQQGLDVIDYMKDKSKHKWFLMTCEVIEPEVSTIKNIKVITDKDIKLNKEQKSFLKNPLKRIPSLLWMWRNRKLMLDGFMRLYESKTVFDNGRVRLAKSNTYINKNWNTFEGWSCSIGLDNVFITWNGDIMGSCTQKIYGLDFSYNILDKHFISNYKPVFQNSVCTIKSCFCTPETHVSKFKLS